MSDNNKVTLTIDGREVTVPKHYTVLQAAQSLGIDIPTFCWHPKLKPVGACRMCYVEIEKRPKLEVSCATPVMQDMVVYTDSEKVKQGRRAVLEFILIDHPLDCPTCDKGGECDLQDLTFAHGVDDSRYDHKKYRFIRDKKSTFDDWRIGPEIIRNQNRCILCFKCVRANKEAFGEHDLGAFQRGNITEIMPPPGRQVANLYSGNLVQICPVGALTNTDWRYKIRVWKTEQIDSICQYCADGCNIRLWRGTGGLKKIFRATARRNDAIDEGWICDVGRYGYQTVHAEGRLTTPLIKKDDTQVPATWEEAIGLVARKFKEIKDKKGGVCIGGTITPAMDNRSLYAFSKFMRLVLNSNNVDFRTDYKMLPEEHGDLYSQLTEQKFKIADIEKSDLIVVIGSNLIKEHPIVNLRVRKTVANAGAKLYTLNPFTTKSADISTDEMIYNIGTLEALLNGVCTYLAENNTKNKLESLIDPKTAEKASAICGIETERIKAFAEALRKAKNISLLVGELVTSSSARELLASVINNLILLAGIHNKGQVGFLSKYSNSMGAQKLGVMPHLSEKKIKKLKSIWGAYPDSAGLAADRMILSATKEDLDSMFVIGSNLMLSYPDGQFVKDGLDKLDFLVVADMFETETTALADVVLPLSSWAEYDGAFVNLEETEQSFKAAIGPVGHSLPAFALVDKIARELKSPLYENPEDMDKDVSELMKLESDNNYAPQLREVRYIKPDSNEEYPYALYVIDELHHFGQMTEKSKSLSAFCSEAFLEMSPSMAEKLKAENGTLIRVESEVGKIVLPLKISEFVENDVLLVVRNFSASAVNVLQMRKRRTDRVKLTRVEEE